LELNVIQQNQDCETPPKPFQFLEARGGVDKAGGKRDFKKRKGEKKRTGLYRRITLIDQSSRLLPPNSAVHCFSRKKAAISKKRE